MKSLMLAVPLALVAAGPLAAVETACECRYDKRIEVRIDKDTLSVTPAAAIVTPKAGVVWEVVGLPPGYSVEIDFRVQGAKPYAKKGPFVSGKSARMRGRYVATSAGAIESNASDQKEGIWKYDVVLRKGDVDVDAIDPSIIIRE
jgi:hypothetical protein